jgi:predicted HD phosphohydrolase
LDRRGQIEHFESLPRAKYAVQLRRWDDLAKEPGKPTPPLAYYLALLDEVRERPSIDWRSRIATASVA